MKDEEMAEEFANEKCKDCYMCSYSEHKNPYKICQRRKDRKQAFLAGLKAGRPQWHYLTENPNDLPDTDRDVWVKRESEIECQIDNYYEDDKGWGIMFREGYCTDDVIAWCEIPTFDKE